MAVLRYVIAFIVLSIVILFHELGHFLLAKKNGIKVNEFCLGLGPTIVGFTKGETKYSIKAFPFGGACIMEGEDTDSKDSRSFQNKSVWARISVVAAGPIFNFIMAFIFSAVIIGSLGIQAPVLSGVMDGYPAQEAGMQAGDEIISINGHKIHTYREISMYSLFHSGEDLQITYQRDDQQETVLLHPEYSEEDGCYLFGFYGATNYTRIGPLKTLQYSAYNVKYWIQYTYGSLRMLVTGRASVQDMSGPVGIVKSIGDTYAASSQSGILYGVLSMMNFSVLLAANLGVINLLPLPALDGGRLVFLFIEAIRRKRVKQEREAIVHFVGLMCLFGLMIFVMVNDVVKLF